MLVLVLLLVFPRVSVIFPFFFPLNSVFSHSVIIKPGQILLWRVRPRYLFLQLSPSEVALGWLSPLKKDTTFSRWPCSQRLLVPDNSSLARLFRPGVAKDPSLTGHRPLPILCGLPIPCPPLCK